MKTDTHEFGPQPIHLVMLAHSLENREVVAKGDSAVTFKVVKKARNGRKLTMRMQQKVLTAVNACLDTPVTRTDLFNYK